MKTLLSSVLSLTLLGAWIGTAAAAPPNDNCASPTVIASLPFTEPGLDTTSATTEGTDPVHSCTSLAGNKSVWYSFTSTFTGTLMANASGSTFLNTVLTAYTGSCGALTQVACGSFAFNLDVTAGTTYLIEATDEIDGGGTLVLNLVRGHDSVVRPVKSFAVKIGVGQTSVTKKVKVKVTNADIDETVGHTIGLSAGYDCPINIISVQPDFDLVTPGVQSTTVVRGGKSAKAVMELLITSAGITTPNHFSPVRCFVELSVDAGGAPIGGDVSNDDWLFYVDITDFND
jgi:hypothetical protein